MEEHAGCKLKKFVFGALSIFGSTYMCEQTLCNMNLIKNKLRKQLTDENGVMFESENKLHA